MIEERAIFPEDYMKGNSASTPDLVQNKFEMEACHRCMWYTTLSVWMEMVP